ncbi:MAG: UvrD-helicase domain-containing protein [Thermoplasmatales archaeon]|nr:UvrD-helicase domain-containing protein [Thermoplasmatales archaeon]
MTGLNEQQAKIAGHRDGFLVVDAGPGTGKTHTIVERYVSMVRNGIDPMDILMVTFTRNAATEMGDRIKARLMEEMPERAADVRTTTFDSYCLSVVLNYPDSVSDFFGLDPVLSRKAVLIENETLNRDHFGKFFDRFMLEHGHRYNRGGSNYSALASKHPAEYYKLITRLMSRGIIPLRYEWFSDGEEKLWGEAGAVEEAILSNVDAAKFEGELQRDDYHADYPRDADGGIDLAAAASVAAKDESRFMHIELIRDLYFAYIERSILDNRLTFALNSIFAFAALHVDGRARETHSVRYMMVDEFQDTNELQLMMCLLLLSEPNLCVVGDWKQGIYGFRFVSIENITNFGERVSGFIRALNSDGTERVPFPAPKKVDNIPLTVNYRSSPRVLECAFQALDAKGSEKDDPSKGRGEIVKLSSSRDGEIGGYTGVDKISAGSTEEEYSAVIARIDDYVNSGKYKIVEKGVPRDPNYGDVAVLCRTTAKCREIRDYAELHGIPAFLQGDLSVMDSREGKLALAWLRYVNNPADPNGRAAILADASLPLAAMKPMVRDGEMPEAFERQRESLLGKRRRPTDLLTSIFSFYGLDNDMTQSVVSILSSAYGGSLLTIPDLIRIIEDDIEEGTNYGVDLPLGSNAITVQTIHKSKGLEYPIVIVSGINARSFPSIDRKGDLWYTDRAGVRAVHRHVSNDQGMEMILRDWKTKLVASSDDTDYSEERRLFFVALSRAKQYITLTATERQASRFFKDVDGDPWAPDPDWELGGDAAEAEALIRPPEIGAYEPAITSLAAHDLMPFIEPDEAFEKGKGVDYGVAVHDAAMLLAMGLEPGAEFPELARVRKILSPLAGAKNSVEISCVLPVGGARVRGVMDLLSEFDDRVEIRDWKTDSHKGYLPNYRMQLSVYAHAASCLGKPVRCFVEYLSLGETVEVDPMPIEAVADAVGEWASGLRVETGDVEF